MTSRAATLRLLAPTHQATRELRRIHSRLALGGTVEASALLGALRNVEQAALDALGAVESLDREPSRPRL